MKECHAHAMSLPFIAEVISVKPAVSSVNIVWLDAPCLFNARNKGLLFLTVVNRLCVLTGSLSISILDIFSTGP